MPAPPAIREMYLIDELDRPGGREDVTNRPVWRVHVGPRSVRWAYIEDRGGRVKITGYPQHRVRQTAADPNPMAGAIAGASAGAIAGVLFGGGPGVAVGALVGALLGGLGGFSGKS